MLPISESIGLSARYGGLAGVLLLALGLRIAVIFLLPSLEHPDENFQFLEQAHRLAFGYGIMPWEFRDGIRSLLLPTLFSYVFWATEKLFGGPQAYIFVARFLLVCLSLLPVAAIYNMAQKRSRNHALIAGIVAACWFELVYFSSRSLTDAIAAHFLLTAIALASRFGAEYSFRRMLAIGFCLGCCAMIRVHLSPAVCIVGWWVLREHFSSRWRPLLVGVAFPVVAFGIADWITWGMPFHSQWGAVMVNILEGKASHYGERQYWWYWNLLSLKWVGIWPVLLALIASGWQRYKVWILVAVAILGSHTLIPHKEYRFVAPAFECLAIVAAIASADLLEWIRPLLDPALRARAVWVLALVWFATSVSLAAAPSYRDNWTRGRELIQLFTGLSSDARLCGLLLYDFSWISTGGYAYLHRNVPIYQMGFGGESDSPRDRWSYNFALVRRYSITHFQPRYVQQLCIGNGGSDDFCVVARQGPCADMTGSRPLLNLSGLGE